MKMGKLKKDQNGFTLIEVLIAIAITGLITWGITMTIFQVFDINTRSTNRMSAITQLENAGLWVSQDVQMAQTVTPSESSGFPLTLTWNDWDTGASHVVNYTLPLEDKKLWREHYIDLVLNSTKMVAEYINSDPAKTSFVEDPEGDAYIFTITATVGGESETRVYKVTPRAG
jgi:prepilin-type N-terminal cleavage/methylation domain-containing protein